MRIAILGTCDAAVALRGLVQRDDHLVLDDGPHADIVVRLEDGDVDVPTIDGIDGPVEARIHQQIGLHSPSRRVVTRFPDKHVQTDRAIRITVPAGQPGESHAVERGVYQGLLKAATADGTPKSRKWLGALWLALLLAWPSLAAAQAGAVAVRDSATGALVPNIGDTANTAMRVYCVGGTCTGGGSGGGTSIADRGTFTFGTTNLTPIGGVFDDTPPAVVTTGMAAALRLTAFRAVHVNLRDASGNVIAPALAATQTDGTQKTQIVDSGGAVVNATGTSLDVLLRDTAGFAVAPLTDAQLRGSAVDVAGIVDQGAPAPTVDAWPTKVTDGTDTANVSGTSLDVNCTSGCVASSFLDNAAFTFNTTPVGIFGAVVDDTGTNAVTENSAGAPRMSTSRVLFGNLRNATGTEVNSATTTPANADLGLVTRSFLYTYNPDLAGPYLLQSTNSATYAFSSAFTPGIPVHTIGNQKEKNGVLTTNDDVFLDLGDNTVETCTASIDQSGGGFNGVLTSYAHVGTTPFVISIYDVENQAWVDGNDITVDGVFIFPCAGFERITFRVSSYVSGSVNLKIHGGPGALSIPWRTTVGVTGSVAVTGTFWQATQPISAASLPLPTGAATEATLSALNAKVTAVNTGAVVVSSSALPAGAATAALQTQPGVDIGDVTVNNGVGAAAVPVQDGGNSLTVDGTVAITNATLAVVGGGVEATALRVTLASDSTGLLSVDDNGGSLTVDGPVTDAQMRATPVPVSGTVTATTTDAEATGTLNSASDAVTVTVPAGASTAVFDVPSASWSAMSGLFQGTVDGGATWFALYVLPVSNAPTSISTFSTPGQWLGRVAGLEQVRMFVSSVSSGTGDATIRVSSGGAPDHMIVTSAGVFTVNIAQVGGGTTATGSGTAVGALRVELPTNGTGVVGLNTGSNIIGRTGIDQTTPGTTNKVSLGTDTVTTKELRAATPTVTSVAASVTNVTCLAANANRLGAAIYSDSTSDVYVKLGATATTSSFTVKLFSDGFFTVPFGYTGIIDCIWTSATGNARVTEVVQ